MLNTSSYRIIAVGKIRKKWIQSGIDLYLKRLPGIKITEVPDSNYNKETKLIKNSLNKGEILNQSINNNVKEYA